MLAAPRFIIDFNTDRVGQDYRRYNTNTMETCLRSCAGESQCRAFTYVLPDAQPGQNNSQGICWLKHGVPQASTNYVGMISGVKQYLFSRLMFSYPDLTKVMVRFLMMS